MTSFRITSYNVCYTKLLRVEAFATSLLNTVARPIALDGQEYFLTASIGIAQAREPGLTAEQLMKDAALALSYNFV